MTHTMSTEYRHTKQVTRLMAGFSQFLAILMSMLRVWLEYAWKQPRVCLEYGWSMARVCQEAAYSEITARASRYYGSCLTTLRLVVTLLLMMVVGVSDVWGEKVDDGVYYIKNNNDGGEKWYLWPAITVTKSGSNYSYAYNYLTTHDGATADAVENNNNVTYPAHDNTYCHWVVKNINGGYIQLINPKLNKYVVLVKNHTLGDGKDVKFQETEPTGDDANFSYFVLNNESSPYKISPMPGLSTINYNSNATDYSLNSKNGTDRTWLTWSDSGTPAKAQLGENSVKGLIQFYGGGTPLWSFKLDLLDAPTISDVNPENNRVTVTDNNGLPTGYNVRYTFSSEGTPEDPTALSEIMPADGFQVTEAGTLKVVIERYGVVLTKVAIKESCTTPEISYDNTSMVTITCARPADATIYYTTDGSDPTISGTRTEYDGKAFHIDPVATVKAVATHANFLNSEVATKTILPYLAPPIVVRQGNMVQITHPEEDDGVRLYYTTDGSDPDIEHVGGSNPTLVYDSELPIALTEDITIIKAMAAKAVGEEGETFDTYSSVVSFNVAVLFGEDYTYLVQSQENTKYFMIPVMDTNNENDIVKTNTTTLGQPSMMWYFLDAGIADDVQYYYMINKHTGKHVYYHDTDKISINDDETFAVLDNAGKEPYRFSISPAEGGGFNICPKNAPTRCIYKNVSNQHNGYINANTAKTNALGRWNFISVIDEKMPEALAPTPITASSPELAIYYSLENEKLSENYVTGANSTIATSVTDDEKWCFVQADKDDWLTYYYIINARSGKYLYQENTTATAAVTTQDYPDEAEAETAIKYQFVLAPSTTEGYYIVPRQQINFAAPSREYISLYTDGTNALRTASRRWWSDDPQNATGDDATVKWKFNKVDVTTCQNPEFIEVNGKMSLTCKTYGAQIYYTTDGSEPTVEKNKYVIKRWERSTPLLVKARAFLAKEEGTPVESDIVTLFINPHIDLLTKAEAEGGVAVDENTYTYDGTEKQPVVKQVYVGTTNETVYLDADEYAIDMYTNNISAGTARVTLKDVKDNNIFLWYATVTFTIKKAQLAVAAEAKEKTYRDPDPELTYNATGFVNEETAADNLYGELTRVAGEEQGTYDILQGSLKVTSDNYSLNYTGAQLTIGKKSLGSGETLASGITIDITKDDADPENVSYPVVVKHRAKKLEEGVDGGTENAKKDYLMTRTTNYPYHVVTLTGYNNYTGTVTAKFANVAFGKPTEDTSKEAGTFASSAGDGPIATPAGANAYIVTGINAENNTVVLEKLEYIPEGVPVLLLTTEEYNGFVVQPAGSGVTTITDDQKNSNLLDVVTEASEDFNTTTQNKHFDTGAIYLLYKGEFVLNKEGDLAKGRVYLDPAKLSSGSGSPAPECLGIVWDETTGIDNVHLSSLCSHLPELWYTLDGRRLASKPTKKGLYLMNGQKIVVK